ncbi:hypothetical protein T07_1051 [Trichinella nelsoni]|uniref:Secreted protein n=1 Tax=Trichinella nelsoni TaxID=6336 RepID=A0A0V0RPF4_9BILA|nr:hypothetical protein T07_1051 [Trichinella nelsoni]
MRRRVLSELIFLCWLTARGNARSFVFHWWLMSPFVHAYNVRRCSEGGSRAEYPLHEKTCGGVFCLSEFFVLAFSVRIDLFCVKFYV